MAIRITRTHYTDLVCAAINDTTGDTQRILDRMKETSGFQIDEKPVEGVFYHDPSVNFMYPHEVKLYDSEIALAVAATGRDIIDKTMQHFSDDTDGLAQKILMSRTFGKLGPSSDLYPPSIKDVQSDIAPKRDKQPSGLLMQLLSKL